MDTSSTNDSVPRSARAANFPSLLVAVAIAGVLVLPTANAASPISEFKAELAARVGSKSGFEACKAAASVLGKFSRSDAPKVKTFTKLALNSLDKARIKVDARSASRLCELMAKNYFANGNVPYHPGDRKFLAALRLIVGAMRLPTNADLDNVLRPLYTLNAKKGGSMADMWFLTDVVLNAGGLPPPCCS